MQIEQFTEAGSERKNGGLLGGYKEVSTNDEEVMDAANFAAEQLSQRSNSLFPFKVKEVCALVLVLKRGLGPINCSGTCRALLYLLFTYRAQLSISSILFRVGILFVILLEISVCRCSKPRQRLPTVVFLTWPSSSPRETCLIR